MIASLKHLCVAALQQQQLVGDSQFFMVAKIPCYILPISIATMQKEVSINAETLTTFSFIALQQT